MIRRLLLRVLPPLGALGALGFSALSPALVRADCTGTDAALIEIDGASVTGSNDRKTVNARECQEGSVLTFRLDSASDLQQYGDLYTFVDMEGDSNDCTDGNVRDDDDSTTEEVCAQIAGPKELSSSTPQYVYITLSGGIDVDEVEDIASGSTAQETLDSTVCGEASSTVITRQLFFLPLSTATSDDDVERAYCYALQVDTDPPSAPTGLEDESGEYTITIDWNDIEDSTLKRYIIYLDPTVGASDDAGTCGSDSLLTAGETYDDLKNPPEGVIVLKTSVGASETYDIDASLIPNTYAAVAVAAQDDADNIGPISSLACLKQEETISYIERYGEVDGGCTIAKLQTSHLTGALPCLAVLLALLMRTRRRTS